MSVRIVHFLLMVLLLSSCATSRKARQKQAKIDKVIATARTYTGTPYKYGGTTRSGMDCSGLLLNAFRAIDMDIPRTSEAQSKIGEKVKIKKLREGDLVFFATGKKKRVITHVGLVTDRRPTGDVWFIHASTSLGVVEANLFTDYYRKRYRKARRLIQ